MNVAIIISGFISLSSFAQELGILKGKFRYYNNFDYSLPANSDVYLLPSIKSTLLECTGRCILTSLCEGFLFNPLSKECSLLRSPLHGLNTVESVSRWKYFHAVNECDVGWSLFKNHCYIHNETTVTWINAKLHCESLRGDLLEIRDQEENEWITQTLLKTDVCLYTCSTWCGGNKVGTQYTWSHYGSVLTYTNWGYGEPSIFAPCMNILSDENGATPNVTVLLNLFVKNLCK